MFVYNITFVVSPMLEKQFIDYLRREMIPVLFKEGSPAMDPDLKKLVEAGGEKPDPSHGLSIALGASFESERLANIWKDKFLNPTLADIQNTLGDQVLFFITLLEKIEL